MSHLIGRAAALATLTARWITCRTATAGRCPSPARPPSRLRPRRGHRQLRYWRMLSGQCSEIEQGVPYAR
ncbi:MAG: hypothetical protein R2838_25030 [Caldilineaceae bacterium]